MFYRREKISARDAKYGVYVCHDVGFFRLEVTQWGAAPARLPAHCFPVQKI